VEVGHVQLVPQKADRVVVVGQGLIVPEDSGDFLTELAREVLAGAALPDLQTLFADDSPISNAAIGSMVKASPLIVTMFELAR